MGYSLVASLAIAAVETVVSASAQGAAADAQNALTSKWSLAQSENVIKNAISQYGQGQQQIIYHDAEARQKEMQENRAAASASATAQVNASSRGVTGTSVDAIQHEYENRRDEFNADAEYNRQAADNEILTQLQGVQTGAQSQLNDISSHYLQPGPSPLSIATQFIGSSVSNYSAAGGFKSPPSNNNPYRDLYIPQGQNWGGGLDPQTGFGYGMGGY